jgi:hypothetical protein
VVVRSIAVVLVMLAPAAAAARATSDLPYTVAETYSAAVRFVRIDRGCTVTDKDAAAAFVTFECKDEDKTKRGSLEIFTTRLGGGREGVRLQVALGDDPHYVELRFLELLERKLRDERGTPPSPPPPHDRPLDGGT